MRVLKRGKQISYNMNIVHYISEKGDFAVCNKQIKVGVKWEIKNMQEETVCITCKKVKRYIENKM